MSVVNNKKKNKLNSIENSSFKVNEEIILTVNCFDKIKTRGRPKYKLNELGCKVIEQLASFFCTEEEIAAFVGVSIETLKSKENLGTFSECYKKGQERGKSSLRQIQFRLAKNNPTMAIFLGKQYLGQSDNPTVNKGSGDKQAVNGSNELKIIIDRKIVDLTDKTKGADDNGNADD